jgi:hypothetical protein
MSAIGDSKGGIEIETIWSDQDVVECRFSCSNGRFSGIAEIYMSHDGLSEMAGALKGFPVAASDVRDLELGTFIPATPMVVCVCAAIARIRWAMR